MIGGGAAVAHAEILSPCPQAGARSVMAYMAEQGWRYRRDARGGFEGGTSMMQQALAASCGGRVEWWEERTADGDLGVEAKSRLRVMRTDQSQN